MCFKSLEKSTLQIDVGLYELSIETFLSNLPVATSQSRRSPATLRSCEPSGVRAKQRTDSRPSVNTRTRLPDSVSQRSNCRLWPQARAFFPSGEKLTAQISWLGFSFSVAYSRMALPLDTSHNFSTPSKGGARRASVSVL